MNIKYTARKNIQYIGFIQILLIKQNHNTATRYTQRFGLYILLRIMWPYVYSNGFILVQI